MGQRFISYKWFHNTTILICDLNTKIAKFVLIAGSQAYMNLEKLETQYKANKSIKILLFNKLSGHTTNNIYASNGSYGDNGSWD